MNGQEIPDESKGEQNVGENMQDECQKGPDVGEENKQVDDEEDEEDEEEDEEDDMNPYSEPFLPMDYFGLPWLENEHFNSIFNSTFTGRLLERNSQLKLKDDELADLKNFITIVMNILGRILDTNNAKRLPVTELVGPYKTNTLINVSKPLTVDIVALVKGALFQSDIAELADEFNKLSSELYEEKGIEVKEKDLADATFIVKINSNETFFVRIHVGNLYEPYTTEENVENKIPIARNVLQKRFSALEQTKWLIGKNDPHLFILIRIFKNIRNRYKGLEPLNDWMLTCLLCYCRTPTPDIRAPITLAHSFARAFMFISSGSFMHWTFGKFLQDPTDMRQRIHAHLTMEEAEQIQITGGHLWRLLCYEETHDQIIGLDENIIDLTRPQKWGDVIVNPGSSVMENNESYENFLEDLDNIAKLCAS